MCSRLFDPLNVKRSGQNSTARASDLHVRRPPFSVSSRPGVEQVVETRRARHIFASDQFFFFFFFSFLHPNAAQALHYNLKSEHTQPI